VADSALQPNGGEPNEVDLRLAAATHQGAVLPELTPADVWRESDAGQVVWHLLEQISETLDDEHRELAARALLAMARLPMRHKPAGLTQEELAEILTTADGWAEQALRLHQNMSSATSGADKAAAMRGLLRLDLAEIRSGQEAIDECEAGTEQLRDVVALRQEAAHVNASAASRENLAKAHFNLGRLVKVAKKLEENGANAGVGEALDDAHTSYLAAARIRENLIAEGGGEGRAPRAQLEDLASSYRGMAIVALTRVCRQDGLTLDRCRDSLSEALKHLTEARRLTCTALRTDVATSNSVASVEMCKDLGVVANVQLCRWLLRDSGREHASNDGKASDNAMRHTAPPSDDTLEARILELRWREAERTVADAVESAVALEIAGDSVPWPAMDSGEPTEPLAAARLALARLTVNHERGGKHIPGSAVLAQFRSDDLPALLRRRASGIMAL
jgi:hypothetical protein